MTEKEIQYAYQEIVKKYGDDVSISLASGALIKFGRNTDIDTGVRETVWATGGSETYQTTNAIDTVVSTNAGDTQSITVIGHTLSGGNFTEVEQIVTLTGTTNVTLTTPLARVERLKNNGSTDFAGTVTVFEDGGTTHLTVAGNVNQSLKCALTTSSSEYLLIQGLMCSVRRAQSASVDFTLEVREPGGVFLTKYALSVGSSVGKTFTPFDNPYIIKPNSDVRVTAETGSNNTQVEAAIHGYKAKIR